MTANGRYISTFLPVNPTSEILDYMTASTDSSSSNTTTMASNKAAWIMEKQGKPVKVDSAEMPTPGADELVIKAGATSVNPVDWKIQVRSSLPMGRNTT